MSVSVSLSVYVSVCVSLSLSVLNNIFVCFLLDNVMTCTLLETLTHTGHLGCVVVYQCPSPPHPTRNRVDVPCDRFGGMCVSVCLCEVCSPPDEECLRPSLRCSNAASFRALVSQDAYVIHLG